MDVLENPQKCEVFGNHITYYREGSGETILLIHGITTYSFIWASMFHALKNEYEVIAVDLLGCGGSDKPVDVDYSIKNQALLIREFLQTLNISKVHVVGHDVGGGIAQILTVSFPDLVITSTFINSVAYDFWPVQPIITIRTPIIRQLAMAILDMGMFKLIIQRGLFYKERVTPELMNYFFAPMRDKDGRKAFLHFAACLNNQDLMDISGGLRQIKTPVLIIRGEADVYLGSVISEKLHSEIPGSELAFIPDGGHFIQIDVPNLLVQKWHKFIKNRKNAT